MANPIEAAWKTMKTLVDNEPKSPLHVGEVYYIWLYYTTIHESNVFVKAAMNTSTDDELLQVIKKSHEQCEGQVKRIKNLMITEGVPLPLVSEEKPNSKPNDVPLGVKLTDSEIANGVSVKTAYAVSMCATAASQAIRSDISLMFMEFEAEKAVFGAEMKVFMRKRGWIKVPPYYTPSGTPQER